MGGWGKRTGVGGGKGEWGKRMRALTLLGVFSKNNMTHFNTASRVGTNSLVSCEVRTVRTEPRSRLCSTKSTSQSIRSFFVDRSGLVASLSSSVVIRSRTHWFTLVATSLVSLHDVKKTKRPYFPERDISTPCHDKRQYPTF